MDIIYIIAKYLSTEGTSVVMYMSLLLVFIVLLEKVGEMYTSYKSAETMNYLRDRVEETTEEEEMGELQKKVLQVYFKRQLTQIQKEDQGFFRVLQSYLLVVFVIGNSMITDSIGIEMTITIGIVLVIIALTTEIYMADNKLKKVKARFTAKLNET